MKKFICWVIASFVVVLQLSFQVVAAQEKCSALLQNDLRNYLHVKYDRNFIDEFHSAICSEQTERINRTKDTGIKLGYEDLVFDFAGSGKKIAAYQSSMCKAEVQASAASEFVEITRNHVSANLTNDYVRCIKIQSGGISYNVSNGTDGASVNIEIGYDARLGVGSGKLNINKIVISPSEYEHKVSCVGLLVDELVNGPIDITTIDGYKTITCRPNPNELMGEDNDFSVFVHTSLGIIQGYVNPFHAGKDDRLDELDNRLTEQLNAANRRIVDLTNQLSSVSDNKISNIEFWNGCNSTTSGNVCDINSPDCPNGFSSSYSWWNTWTGGRCGHGNKCRVCVRISN